MSRLSCLLHHVAACSAGWRCGPLCETREFNIISSVCVSYNRQHLTSVNSKCLKHLILQSIKLLSPLSASFPSLIFSVWSLSFLLSADWCCLFLFSWTLLFSAELIRISAGCDYRQITGWPTHKWKLNSFMCYILVGLIWIRGNLRYNWYLTST